MQNNIKKKKKIMYEKSKLRKYSLNFLCSFYDTYARQSESTLYNGLNVKEVFAGSRQEIWSLTDCNWTWVQNHLVREWTLNHLAKLVECSFTN